MPEGGKMKLVTTMIVMAILLQPFITAGVEGAEDKHLVRIDISGVEDIENLMSLHLDIASFEKGKGIDAVLSDAERDRVEAIGYPTSYIIQDLNHYFQKNINMDGDLGAYHTYAEMLPLLQLAEARFPNICRLYDIGDSWEKTEGIADRDIWAIKISDDVGIDDPTEPEILFVGNHHARELITVEIPLAIIRELLTKYGRDPQITNIVDNKETWVVPMLNPDGHVRVETVDPWWRKNLNRNDYGSPYYWGVDLNRNYGYQWGYNDWGSSPYEWAEDYRGTAPFSEPETQAIRDLAESHEYTIALSYHSYGDLFLFPWCYIDEDTPDHPTFELISLAYTQYNGYTWGNANDGIIYNTNGDHDDWMYGEQTTKNMVLGCTVEVGHSFWPEDSQIPVLIEENLQSALALIRGI
jgi:murein tripeptide amidase MpaA